MCPHCDPEADLRAALTSRRPRIDGVVCPHCGTRQSEDLTPWWHNPPLDRRAVQEARRRAGRENNPGIGLPRALYGRRYHPPPSGIGLPMLRGITDQDGSILTGGRRKDAIARMRGQMKDEERAAAAADRTRRPDPPVLREAAETSGWTPWRHERWGEDPRMSGTEWQEGRSHGR